MRLNNYGFGMREMIIYSCILLFILFFAAVEINIFYSNLENDDKEDNTVEVKQETDEDDESSKDDESSDDEKEVVSEEVDYAYYSALEKRLEEAARQYLNEYKYDLSENSLKITSETLVNFGYMEAMYDQTGSNICTGYVNAYGSDEVTLEPFISCNNYSTGNE